MPEIKQLHIAIGPCLSEVFVLTVNTVLYLGYRTLDAHIQTGSLLAPWMLLGRLQSAGWKEDGLHCRYVEPSLDEKHDAFRLALASPRNRLHFPFPVIDEQGEELVPPPAFWDDIERLANRLDSQECHFRQLSIEQLRQLGFTRGLLYDPACSTGTFIGALAEALPNTRCLGSDLSPCMIEHARQRNARAKLQFSVADAASPIVAPASCDVLVLRFLNAEVMLRDHAVALFHSLIERLKPGGVVILFGHTPLLFAVNEEASRAGLNVLRSLAALPGCDQIFQFYVLERPPN